MHSVGLSQSCTAIAVIGKVTSLQDVPFKKTARPSNFPAASVGYSALQQKDCKLSKAAFSVTPSTMAASAEASTIRATSTFLRLATINDVPQILGLIRHLAEFEKLLHECHATEEALRSTLFNLPPFQGPTVLLLEIAEDSASAVNPANGTGKTDEQIETVASPIAIEDPELTAYRSAYNPNRIVVGMALFFPNYSTFLAKPGFYLEDLCVREPYRRCGFGTKLLTRLAQLAVRQEAGRLEWSVLDWNEKAINFYKGRMGAAILDEWRICRLTGPTLEAAGKAPESP